MIPAVTLPFVHPALVGAAFAAGLIPVVIHLLNRRRHRRVRWAAMRFLLAASRRSAKRIWLEQWILLFLRVAVVVLLGLAVARPFMPATAMTALGQARVHRILVMDNSLSMNARTPSGESRFAGVKAAAEQLIAGFPPGDAVSVITMANPAAALIGHAVYDRRSVRERLSGLSATQRSVDVVGAVEHALGLLRDSPAAPRNRAVYVLSDFRQRVWVAGEGAAAAPTPASTALRALAERLHSPANDLTLIDAGSDAANVAVTRLAAESPLVTPRLPVQLTVEVTNFGTATARNVVLHVRRDGRIVRQEPLAPLPPRGTSVTSLSLEFTAAGTHLVETSAQGLTPDALPEDDVRLLSVEVRERVSVLLVDGRPGTTPLSGQAGFLATALGARPAGVADDLLMRGPRSGGEELFMEARVVSAAEWESEALSAFDVVGLCNVAHLTSAQWARLNEYVSRGGGLAVFGGDLVGIENYNRHGFADGSGLLPGRLGAAVVLGAPPDGGAFVLSERVPAMLGELAGFADSGLFFAQVDRYLPLTVEDERAEVALRLFDGSPALVLRAVGRGRVAVFTTTANMEWNNLPAKGDFVSLMLNLFSYLAPRHGGHRNLLVGETIREPLSAAQSELPLRVSMTGEASIDGRVMVEGEGLALVHGPVERAGPVYVAMGVDSRVFAVNVDAEGSDLPPVEADALRAVVSAPFRRVALSAATVDAPQAARSTELSTMLFCAVLALLVAEMWTAMYFGRGARVP